MRIGVGGGPFYVSGRVSTAGCAPWAAAFAVLFVAAVLVTTYPIEAGIVIAGIVGLLVWSIRRGRQRYRAQLAQAAAQIQPAPVATVVERDPRIYEMLEELTSLYAAGKVGDAKYAELRDQILAVEDEERA